MKFLPLNPPSAMGNSTTPPSLASQSRLRSRPIPRLSRPFDDPIDSTILTTPSPRNLHSPNHLTIQELLLLPPSPNPPTKLYRIADVSLDPLASESTPRRKSKGRMIAASISPRNGRRARRRLEKEIVISQLDDDALKLKKPRQGRPRPARKENKSLATDTKKDSNSVNDQSSLEGICTSISDLVMWKHVAKSSFWFGLGSILFLSSIFSGDIGFSIISSLSYLGIVILGMSFFLDSIKQRKQSKKKTAALRLTEEDVLRIVRVVLPVINFVISENQKIFSGEPLMTLKVAPILLVLAKYGHFTTPWRLLAIGFFVSFTMPKLHSCYHHQIHQRVDEARSYAINSWKSCSRKKFVAISAVALLWNILGVKMRIFIAFIIVVFLRHYREQQFILEHVVEEKLSEVSKQGMCSKEDEHREIRLYNET